MTKSPSGKQFIWAGNDLCLDFVNTEVVQGGRRVDLIDDFAALVTWLRDAGRLTASEATLAAELAQGTSLIDLARKLGISRSTVRTHLARVFAKTSTRRQPELIALLSRLAILS